MWQLQTPAILTLLALAFGVGCGKMPPKPTVDRCVDANERPDTLIVAGSGSNLPTARALASLLPGDQRPIIAESIGTSGALRALRDGRIDVGLASRQLTGAELRDVQAVPYAHSRLVVGAHPKPGVRTISQRQLLSIYHGETTSWPDGTPIVPLLREAGDSGEALVNEQLPALGAAMAHARESGRGLVLYTDQEMASALMTVVGSVGFIDAGLILRSDVRALQLDGQSPDSAGWPLVKTLSFVTPRQEEPESTNRRVVEFVALAGSDDGRRILRRHGCDPYEERP